MKWSSDFRPHFPFQNFILSEIWIFCWLIKKYVTGFCNIQWTENFLCNRNSADFLSLQWHQHPSFKIFVFWIYRTDWNLEENAMLISIIGCKVWDLLDFSLWYAFKFDNGFNFFYFMFLRCSKFFISLFLKLVYLIPPIPLFQTFLPEVLCSGLADFLDSAEEFEDEMEGIWKDIDLSGLLSDDDENLASSPACNQVCSNENLFFLVFFFFFF